MQIIYKDGGHRCDNIVKVVVKVVKESSYRSSEPMKWQNVFSNAAHYCSSSCIFEHGTNIPNLFISNNYELVKRTLFFPSKKN